MDEHLKRQFGVDGVGLLDDAQQPTERFLDWLILPYTSRRIFALKRTSWSCVKTQAYRMTKKYSCDPRASDFGAGMGGSKEKKESGSKGLSIWVGYCYATYQFLFRR